MALGLAADGGSTGATLYLVDHQREFLRAPERSLMHLID